MNNTFKFVSGIALGIMIGGLSVVGANQAIQAIQNTEIKVTLNGKLQEFRDEKTGEAQYPITYQDRTYLPLRTIANLLGINVDYNEKTKTAILEAVETSKNFKIENRTPNDASFIQVLEKFYEDNEYTYSFGTPISEYIVVVYQDGTEEKIKSALTNKHVTISDLDKFNITYYKDKKDTTILTNSSNINLNNTLSYDEMVDKLKLSVYSNLTEVEEAEGRGEMVDVNSFIYDIDNNGVPEIIRLGNPILARRDDCFQVFTLRNDKVVSTVHEHSMINVALNIYQTNEGVFVYELSGIGPETYENIYKLELNGLELTKKDLFISATVNGDYGPEFKDSYKVDGVEVSKEEYNNKIKELKSIKLIKSLHEEPMFFGN